MKEVGGYVEMDGVKIGDYTIQYEDYKRDGLPVQILRRKLTDKVYLDSVEIGYLEFEWDDKVADINPGSRTLIIPMVVRLIE